MKGSAEAQQEDDFALGSQSMRFNSNQKDD